LLRLRVVPPPCCVRFAWSFLIVGRGISASANMVTHSGIHNPAMICDDEKGNRAFILSHFRRSEYEVTYR
jgi:hypothetical protein